jgi:serine/threonine-protein kinase
MADAFGAPGSSVPPPIGPGGTIAGYLIEEQVGAGGMAVVFRARDEMLGRRVALKVMSPAIAADPEFRARFIRESRAIAAVDHPHIVPVYAAGEAGGVLYIATRFIPGGDLAGLVARSGGVLAPDRAAALITQVASALDAAHAAGLVHRDVKLANVLVDSQGGQEHAYLSDFGLTKGTSFTAGLTAEGQFMGTPDYCPPEQIAGRPVGRPADQYALACAAFRVLTGSLPFTRPEVVATLFAHMNDPVPVASALRPGLPPGVDAVLARALAKNPDDRYPSCGQFASALRYGLGLAREGFQEAPYRPAGPREQPAMAPRKLVPSRPASLPAGFRRLTRHRTALAIGGAGTLVLAAAGVGVALASGVIGPQAPSATVTGTIAISSTAVPVSAAFSPDGSLVAIAEQASGRNDNGNIVIANTSTGTDVATLTLPAQAVVASAPVFSSDDKTITALVQPALATSSASPGGVDRWDISTGSRSTLLPLPQGTFDEPLTLSPDGGTLMAQDADYTLHVFSVNGNSGERTLPDPGGLPITHTSIDDDQTISVAEQNGTMYLYNASSGSPVGQVSPRHTAQGAISFEYSSLSPDGSIAVTAFNRRSVTLWNIAAKANITPRDPRWTAVTGAIFSANGHLIATTATTITRQSVTFDLWKAGGAVSHFLTVPVPDDYLGQPLCVSPDGTKVLVYGFSKPSSRPLATGLFVESVSGL